MHQNLVFYTVIAAIFDLITLNLIHSALNYKNYIGCAQKEYPSQESEVVGENPNQVLNPIF